MMFSRPTAAAVLGALFALSFGPAPAATAPVPIPTASPLKTIKHVYATRLCTGLRRSVLPAVGHILQNDHVIATSRPLFQDYVKTTSTGSQAATDMDVMRLEKLISPLVKNTQATEQALRDTIYPRKPQSNTDKQLLQIRAHLAQVLEEQKRALDLVSGFVDTQQLGELQAAGHEYDKSISGNETTTKTPNNSNNTPNTSPTAPPADILNAGVSNANNDPARKYDPRYTNTGSQLGYNPLNVFDQQMEQYQMQISQSENLATQAIMKAVPQCGGQIPAPPAPAPLSASPVPASPLPVTAPVPSPVPTGKP